MKDEQIKQMWIDAWAEQGTGVEPDDEEVKALKSFLAKVRQHYEQEGLKVLIDGEWVEASDEFKATVRSIDAGLKGLDRPDRGKIIDLLHWTEYTFIGQANAIFEGILTQESEEQIADKLQTLIPDIEELKRNWNAIYKDAKIFAVEEAKKQERKRIGFELEDVQLVTPYHDGTCHISTDEHKWWKVIMRLRDGQALKEEKEQE